MDWKRKAAIRNDLQDLIKTVIDEDSIAFLDGMAAEWIRTFGNVRPAETYGSARWAFIFDFEASWIDAMTTYVS